MLTPDCSTVDMDKLFGMAVERSPRSTCSIVDLAADYQLELQRGLDPLYYCNGHDFLAMVSKLARSKWGGPGGKDSVAVAMRSAVSCADLRSTNLFGAVIDWAGLHSTRVWDCDAA